MAGSLSEGDTHAISMAVRILTEAGYGVEKVNQGTRSSNGVEFKLELEAPTKTPRFHPQAEAVKAAAMDTPERDMAGDVLGGENAE